MSLIPKSFIQDVVSRTDIVSIIAARIDLKKRGGTHTACCPFHHEKTPSFSVSQSKQFFYCFGCGAHGDVIKFLMDYDHLSFMDAVTDLAQALGLTVPQTAEESNTAQNAELYTVMQHAQSLYEKALKEAPVAIEYLKNRGLTGKTAKAFGIGYAKEAWDFLAKSSHEKATLVTTGMLIEKSPGHYYDRFRNRVLFPIRDIRGRTIGFGGRTLTNETPKYLNSPETPIFHKSQTLYGLYEALQNNRSLKRVLVVEGYLDVISLAQANISCAVATLGTALNAKHIQLLLRYTNDIIFCFDGDQAGQKAAMKALTLSLPLLRDGLNFRFLFLPNGEDPDSLVRKIQQPGFEKLMNEAASLSDVFFDELAKNHSLSDIAGKAAFAKSANDLIHTMPEGIYKNLLLDKLAEKLSLAREKLNTPTNMRPPEKKITRIKLTGINPAIVAIQLLLQTPSLAQLAASISFDVDSPEKKLLATLITHCQNTSSLSFGDVLSETEDESTRTLLATIANMPLHIPEAGYKAEFTGALTRLVEHTEAKMRADLIEKTKHSTLTSDEMDLLRSLIAKKQSER